MTTSRFSLPARAAALVAALALALTALAVTGAPAGAVSTTSPLSGLASVTPGGKASGGAVDPDLSDGGRFVAFTSTASTLVPGDTNGVSDVFVRDTLAATTTRVSVTSAETQANGSSSQASISSDGRWVAFRSTATNLVAGDTNAAADVFLRDLDTGTTTRVSISSTNGQATGASSNPDVADTGAVAFESSAPDLVADDTNGVDDVFLRTPAAKTTRVSLCGVQEQAALASSDPSISPKGDAIAFVTRTKCWGLDTDQNDDVLVRKLAVNNTAQMSKTSTDANFSAPATAPSMSDGGKVAFQTEAVGIDGMPGEPAGASDIFVRSMEPLSTARASVAEGGAVADGASYDPTISRDGSRVAFTSEATDLVPGDTNAVADGFTRDLTTKATQRASVRTGGGQATLGAVQAALAPDGTATAFTTAGSDLGTADANLTTDVYWRGSVERGAFPTVDAFVVAVYQAFAGRLPTAAERLARAIEVADGVRTPASIIDDMAHGSFATHEAPVGRLYTAYFHRVPDAAGLAYWVGQKQGGKDLAWIASFFSKSKEFTDTYGAVNDATFVHLVYQNVLERDPDANGLAYWVDRLDKGLSRGGVMVNFSESPEGKDKMRAEVDSLLFAHGMLGRMPTAAEVEFGQKLLDNTIAPSEVLVDELLRSQAYDEKY